MDLQDNTTGTGTQSICNVEIVNGSYCYTINDYSLITKGIGVGNHIASKSFTVGSHQWAIYFYPYGKSAKEKEYISAYIVVSTSDGEDVRAILELGLIDPSINGYCLGQQAVWCRLEHPIASGYPQTLKNGEMWGASQFCPREYLEQYGFLKNDILSISCKVCVVVSRTTLVGVHSISVPEPDIGESWGALLDGIADGSTSGDVTFEVDGELFEGHKLVLAARSPVFKSQLYGPMPCGNSNRIHVKDMVAPVFKALLHFIYTDILPDMSSGQAAAMFSSSSLTLMMQHLLVAANRYGLNRLRLLCELKLCEDMSTDTVAITLTLAEQHHAWELKAYCLKYAAANIAAVMQSEGFNYLKNSCPSLEGELLRAVADSRLQ